MECVYVWENKDGGAAKLLRVSNEDTSSMKQRQSVSG